MEVKKEGPKVVQYNIISLLKTHSTQYTPLEGAQILSSIYIHLMHVMHLHAFGEGRMAEWLRYWTLNHEFVGLSPNIH